VDEPTSGVDPLARREFWARIIALAESGVTILVSTHLIDGANDCDRLVIMAEGTPADLKASFWTPERLNPILEDAFITMVEDRA
jgi:ABC-2 type transport system ATP-binding protein